MVKRRKFDMYESNCVSVFNRHINAAEGWLDNFPDNEEKKIVMQKLSEASMWAGACMANKKESVASTAHHTCSICRHSRAIGGHLRCDLIFECIEENDEAVIIAPKMCLDGSGGTCAKWQAKK